MGVRRPELVLGASLLVCAPMVPGILDGSIGTTTALVRLLGAIVVCWILAAIVQAVIDRYQDAATRREFEVQTARARASRATSRGPGAEEIDGGSSAPQ
jgi:hypothetical protein